MVDRDVALQRLYMVLATLIKGGTIKRFGISSFLIAINNIMLTTTKNNHE